MSFDKYQRDGAYHYRLYKTAGDPYRLHVLDVVDKVKEFARPQGSILDVGAGEGLVTRVLMNAGFNVEGCDTDEHAVKLAQEKGNPISRGDINQFVESTYDAILVLDVLEHIEEPDFEWTMNAIKHMTDLVFIAVPDVHDAHGFRDFARLSDVFDLFTPEDLCTDEWEPVHADSRHGRYFVVMRRKAHDTP